jgi:acyl-CoA thioesterase-2
LDTASVRAATYRADAGREHPGGYVRDRLDLLELLDLTPTGDDVFTVGTRGEVPGRLFGGLVASQTLRAATLTVDPARPPHSLHAYFIRPGKVDVPLTLDVERTRDGRSFTTRQVTATQEGKPIFILSASFHGTEDGADWQLPGPSGLPDPEQLAPAPGPPPTLSWSPFDIRPAAEAGPDGFPVVHPLWVRTLDRMPDDPALHACILTFISDIAVAPSARAPGASQALSFTGASLDHAVWFHRPVRTDEWLLFWTRPVSNFGARGFAEGAMQTRTGVRVASIAQEVLLRNSGVEPRF